MILPVDRDEILLLILDFLKSQNYIKTMVTLESEANIAFEDLPEEIKFFKDLLLNGDFETSLNFIELFKKAENFPYNQCVFSIKKQKFLELVENNNEEEVDVLINLSKEIEKLTTREKYNELCYFLTLKKVSDHPDYANWNIYKGRMGCFNEIKQYLKQVLFTTTHKEKEKVKPNSLLKLLTALVELMVNQNRQKFAQIFSSGQDFSFLNPTFSGLVEDITANSKLSLITNKSKNQTPYENLSRSIDFRKNLPSPQEMRHFGVQSTHFENLRSQLEEEAKRENTSVSGDKRANQLRESTPVIQQSQQTTNKKNQVFQESMMSKNQSAMSEAQKSEKLLQSQAKSYNKSGVKFDNDDFEDQHEQVHESQYVRGSQQMSAVSQSGMRSSPFDQRASEVSQSMKKSLKEPSPQKEADKLKQSREPRSLVASTVSEKYDPMRGYQYDIFTKMSQIGQIQDIQPIRAASFAPDGEMFAIGTNSKTLKIYTMRPLFMPTEAEYPHSIELVFEKNNHHFGSIYSVDWSNTGRFIASGSNDKLIKVISVPDFKNDTELMELKLPGHKGIVRSVAFTLDDTRLLSASADSTLKVWDVQEGMEIRTLSGHSNAVSCLQVNGDGNLCISVGTDKCLKLWDLRAYECSASIPMNDYGEMNYVALSENTKNYSALRSNEQRRGSKSITPGGNIIAAAAHIEGIVTLWDITTRKLMEIAELHEADCRSVEFDSTSGLIATSSFDTTIGIYDINQRVLLNRIQNHTDRVVFAKWHPFYPIILSTSADTTARLFAPERFLQSLHEDTEGLR